MTWEALSEGLQLIALGMLGSVVCGITVTVIRDLYFPGKPEDDYTYVIQSLKSRKKFIVTIPPDLPEAEQQMIMRKANEALGLPAMEHYPVPMPRDGSRLWRLRRHTTKAFLSGDSQAVKIPAEIAYARPDIDLDIQRVGDELRIRPAQSN